MAGIDSYVKLMLHCDGSDGSTTFTDSSRTPKTVTAYNGPGKVQVETDQSKFGGASGFFNPTGAPYGYLGLADHEDWDLGSGDFTIDFWIRIPADVGQWVDLIGQWQQSWVVAFNNAIIDGFVAFSPLFYYKTTTVQHGVGSTTTGMALNTWYHIAFVRSTALGTIKLYQDGVETGSYATTDTIDTSTNPLAIGSRAENNTQPFWGYIDELRYSKGIARWTANFTPPTAAYSVDTRRSHPIIWI